jgi:hypothetical protein
MELTDPWQAQTFKMLPPRFETQLLYSFNLNAFCSKVTLAFIQNDIKKAPSLSQYS